MTTTALDKELIDLEKQYWDAIRDKDSAAVTRLTADKCLVAGAQGIAALDKAALAGMLNDQSWDLKQYEFGSDIQVMPIGHDVAIVGYKVTEHLAVEGKPLTLEAYDSSVWVKQDGTWRCALHTESVAGDPFGRAK